MIGNSMMYIIQPARNMLTMMEGAKRDSVRPAKVVFSLSLPLPPSLLSISVDHDQNRDTRKRMRIGW
jgi:hypothetical protein